MRIILAVILCLSGFSLLAQPADKNISAIASFVGFSSSGGAQYTGTISNWQQPFDNYLPTQIQAGDYCLDAFGRWYEILTINTANFAGANVTIESQEVSPTAPSGRGVVWRPIGRGLIPPMPTNNGQITTYLRSLIDNHNARQVAGIGGGQVEEITTLSDTVSVVDPAEGHVLVKQDGTLAAFYDGTTWLVLTGGAGGPGSGDDWGDQSVVTDGSTLDGDGTPGDPLGVNTTVIATRTWTTQEFDDRIEVTVTQTGAVTGTVTLPTQVDTRYPVHIYRGAAFNTSAFSGSAADWTISGTTATSNYRPLEADEILKIIYTELQ